ncbi:MAG TPA: hypothetical protein VMY78_00175 [Solirubrobacteraceae bacterium]|nr:hypothetical protein [Solirubrobacteraceae bacterium]
MPRRTRRATSATLTVLVLSLALPALAPAASTKPAVTTGAAANITPTTASLLGKVDPNEAQTTYLFQYGPTTLYGLATPITAAGAGTVAVTVLADLTSLAPATTYHYRLVAHNRNGTVNGVDRSFKTKVQPLGLTLAASPNPVPFGRPTILGGTLSGTNNDSRPIVLQSNPFPYTQGFTTISNAQLTNAQGAFAFPLLSVPLNTQYRVLIPDKPEVQSPIVGVSVAVRVSTFVTRRRVRTNGRVRFFGRVTPARPGAQVAIQKQRGKDWITVAGTITHGTGTSSRYGKTIRIRRGGNYRVFVSIVDGNFASNNGRTVRITRRF